MIEKENSNVCFCISYLVTVEQTTSWIICRISHYNESAYSHNECIIQRVILSEYCSHGLAVLTTDKVELYSTKNLHEEKTICDSSKHLFIYPSQRYGLDTSSLSRQLKTDSREGMSLFKTYPYRESWKQDVGALCLPFGLCRADSEHFDILYL